MKGQDIDLSKVKDLYDDDELLEQMDADDNMIIEDVIDGSGDEEPKKSRKGIRKQA